MKLYIANGVYVGTQDEARKINKTFEQVEVPTDKAGLIEYLNGLRQQGVEDEFAVVVERNDPPVAPTGSLPNYADWSSNLEDQWEKLPLAHKLHFAALAVEDAREAFPALEYTSAENVIGAAAGFRPAPGEGPTDDPFA